MAQTTSNNRALWLGLGAIILVVSLLTYMLVLRPVMSDTADLKADAEAATLANETLELAIQKLQAESKKVPEYEAVIADVATDLPPREDLADFDRYLIQLFQRSGAELVDREWGATFAVTGPEVPVAPAPVDPGVTDGTAPTPSPSPSPSPTVSAAPVDEPVGGSTLGTDLEVVNLFATPVTLGAPVSQDQALLIIASLQNADHRYFAITSFAIERLEPDDTRTLQLPPILPDDVWLSMEGLLFTYPQEGIDPNETILPDGFTYPTDDFGGDPAPDFYERWIPSQPLADAVIASSGG